MGGLLAALFFFDSVSLDLAGFAERLVRYNTHDAQRQLPGVFRDRKASGGHQIARG